MPIPVEQQHKIIERIKYLIAQQGLSQARFAGRLGISAANMSKHLNGKLPITNGLVNRICLDYNVSRRWLLNGEDTPFAKDSNVKETPGQPAQRGVPVYDIDVTAGFGSLDRICTEDRISGYVNLPGLNNSYNERLVRVSGDSMEPAIQNGSYIAIREQQADSIAWGHIYVIVTDTNRMVKTVRQHHSDAKTLILHSENPEYKDVELHIKKVIGLYKVDAVINFASN